MTRDKDSGVPEAEGPSLLERIGLFGLIKLSTAILLFIGFTFFYTMLPLAGLQLLPFLFFGTVALIAGVADDLGLYNR